jgi:hypothetical protein
MVRSLLGQPYLKEAVARLPWETCDLTKVKAEVCQELREVLERHRLPNTVHDHYDYRHLQLPEKLAHYAFRLLFNGEPFPDNVSTVASGTGIGETEPFYNRHRDQMLAPVFNMSGSTALSYWNSEDPSAYDENAHQSVETGHVPYTKPLSRVPVITDGTHRSRSGDKYRRRHSRSLSRSRERRQDDYHSFEKRDHRRDQTPLPTFPDMTLGLSKTTAAVDHNTDSARTESKEAGSISPELRRLSERMSDVRMEDWFTLEPNEPYNP